MEYMVLEERASGGHGSTFAGYYAGSSLVEAEQIVESLEQEGRFPCLVRVLRSRRGDSVSRGYSRADAARLRVWLGVTRGDFRPLGSPPRAIALWNGS